MVAGANTHRVETSIDRFASVLNLKTSSQITHKSIIMTLYDEKTDQSCTRVKNIPPYLINFFIISSISKASWTALSDQWSVDQIAEEIERIKTLKRYPRWIVLIAVSLAGAGFCNLFDGDYLNMLVAFISTLIGLFLFQETHKLSYNLYIRIFLGSFVASACASMGMVFDIGANPQTALMTSILFLVPGVPLINSFTDLLDGHIVNGVVRFTTGLMIVLAMALGLFLNLYLFHLKIK